jgi:hypothetical protein
MNNLGRILMLLASVPLLTPTVTLGQSVYSVVETYLKNGLGRFKFGLPFSEIKKMMPDQTKIPEWNNLSRETILPNLEYRKFSLTPRAFGDIKYLWDFRRETEIFSGDVCFSKATAVITFLFYQEQLNWIRLGAVDAPDCPSHRRLFEAIARFYDVSPASVEFEGIGVVLTTGSRVIKVTTSSPAYEAGIIANDEIISIDGLAVRNLDVQQVVDKLQGPANTRLDLSFKRANAITQVHLIRRKISDGEWFNSLSGDVCLSGLYSAGASIIDIRRPSPLACKFNAFFPRG